ncbi:MAG: radical SAM protein [Candidatus Saganbacteria bacterium]|nr:radical SAM protein [Candidatus Saganbacteria bacterium]
MRPLVCNYYLTYKCNDTCEFCDVWKRSDISGIEEVPLETVKKNLADLKELGVVYIDFTGGEPLLRGDLPEILKYGKELGFYNTLTTNGILYKERSKEIKDSVDRLLFSLDAPDPEEHERIRGVYSYEPVIESIKEARSLGQNPVVNFTITRSRINFLPEMVELCQANKLLLWINPVFNQNGFSGFEGVSIDYMKYFFKNKQVGVNLAELEFMRRGGNNRNFPRCRAIESVITISPDDDLLLPCFYLQKKKIKINGELKKVYRSREAGEMKRQEGRFDFCRGCMVWSYVTPSFLYKIDKYFFLNLYSIWDLWWKEYRIKKEVKK